MLITASELINSNVREKSGSYQMKMCFKVRIKFMKINAWQINE
jgi:hypothetical protein